MERIYARCWNFMCHESQIPQAGDFFLNFIGEDSVIAWLLDGPQAGTDTSSCAGFPSGASRWPRWR